MKEVIEMLLDLDYESYEITEDSTTLTISIKKKENRVDDELIKEYINKLDDPTFIEALQNLKQKDLEVFNRLVNQDTLSKEDFDLFKSSVHDVVKKRMACLRESMERDLKRLEEVFSL